MYDLFMITYDEPMADYHWRALHDRFPSARRIEGVKGIHAAHRAAATASRTKHFWVVDADNEVIAQDFSYKVPEWDSGYVHLWHAKNPVNGLVYGWGGIKLFPRRVVLDRTEDGLDMTTSFELKIIPECASITHFNYAPFETWRAAFREAVKLTLAGDPESRERLDIWTSRAEGAYSEWCLSGAIDGQAHATAHNGNIKEISKINDYEWLKSRFEEKRCGMPSQS